MLRDSHHGKACPYCHRIMDRGHPKLQPTRDHVIPASRGGVTKIICCITCNGLKADKMPMEWEAFMQENPGWWMLSRTELRARARAQRRQYDYPNKHGDRIVRRAPRKPVIVPPELIYTP